MSTQHVNSNTFSKSNIDRNVDRAEGAARSAIDSTKEQAQHLMDEAKGYAETGTKIAKEKFREVEDVVKDKSDFLVEYIKDQPVKSVVIALGVGYLLNSMFKK